MIELLVVLAILGFLLALLLPAVQRVRHAAARTQSQNNLKQLGLGCLNYESTYKRLPSGNDQGNYSAAAHLLPYIEQDNLFRQININVAMDNKANADVRQTRILVFESPLDPQKQVNDQWGPTNYLFNAGSKPSLTDNDGVCFQDSKIRIADIVDGTSNTLIAGETLKGDGGTRPVDVRRQNVVLGKDALNGLKEESGVAEWKAGKHIAGDRCASWMDGRFLQGTFTGTRILNDGRPDVNCAGAGGLSGLRSLDKGTNVGFCDGHVIYLSGNISLETWRRLTARNDGQELPEF
jgi:prepilin-type processing-associated H-X9-DG protein